MNKSSNDRAAGLQEPLQTTEAVTAEIERAANHALVIGTVLAHELPAELQVGEVAQAIEQTEELEQQLAESAEKLSDVSTALEQEIVKRRALTRELGATRERVEQLVDAQRPSEPASPEPSLMACAAEPTRPVGAATSVSNPLLEHSRMMKPARTRAVKSRSLAQQQADFTSEGSPLPGKVATARRG